MGAAVAEMEEDQAASVMKLVSVSTADREKAVHARCQVRPPIELSHIANSFRRSELLQKSVYV